MPKSLLQHKRVPAQKGVIVGYDLICHSGVQVTIRDPETGRNRPFKVTTKWVQNINITELIDYIQ